MQNSIPWVFYVSEMGRETVLDELRKIRLDKEELRSVEQILRNIEVGAETWKDSTYLGRDIWEARVRLRHRQVRILYSIEEDWAIHLALFAAVKKVQKVPPQWIDIAIKRRKIWLRRNETN